MKKRYFTAALCAALLLASGCSSSKKVSTTCSTDILGMKMSVEISAPSENDKVDAMAVKVDIPLSIWKHRVWILLTRGPLKNL